MQQKIWFGKYKWTVFKDFNYNYNSIPSLPCVYILLVRIEDIAEPIIAYVGVTKDAHSRMKSHIVLRLLQYNKKNYQIYILCKDFGKGYSNNYKEKKFIYKYKPAFNTGKDVPSFWESIGVNRREIIYKKKREKISKFDEPFIRL